MQAFKLLQDSVCSVWNIYILGIGCLHINNIPSCPWLLNLLFQATSSFEEKDSLNPGDWEKSITFHTKKRASPPFQDLTDDFWWKLDTEEGRYK